MAWLQSSTGMRGTTMCYPFELRSMKQISLNNQEHVVDVQYEMHFSMYLFLEREISL